MDEEIKTMEAQRKPGRPPNKLLEFYKTNLQAEEREFNSGFWLPDLQDAGNLAKLQAWRGDWNSLATMQFVRITKNGVKHASRFPPNGQS
jgi:translation machinery-associated protein 16